VASTIPVDGGPAQSFEIEGRPGPPDEGPAQFLTAGPDHCRLVGASTISGRDFNGDDRVAGLSVAIVNQASEHERARS
jgi:hypothetical protein